MSVVVFQPSTLATVQQGGFGSFVYMCRDMTSYPFCNLFYEQLSRVPNFRLDNPLTAPVGINPTCGIPRAGRGNLGNIANIILCAISAIFTFYLIQRANRRRAAVGRIEITAMLYAYLVTILLQLITTGGFLEQGSISLVILTALHAAAVVVLFWTLLANGLVATQIVEDGTASSLIPFFGLGAILFLVTLYISIDTAFGLTSIFKSNPPRDLRNIGLFLLLDLWPIICVTIYFGIMAYIITFVLREKKPLFYYGGALVLFIGSQLVYFLAGTPLCLATKHTFDGSFLATFLETLSVAVLFLGWRAITESEWEDQVFVV